MAALNVFLHMLEPEDIQPLRDAFYQMDKDKTGFISVSELKEAVSTTQLKMTDEQIESIMKEVDHHGNGKINYSEFLAATISVKDFITEEKLWMIFKHFDVDDTNYISKDNIEQAMQKLGKQISK